MTIQKAIESAIEGGWKSGKKVQIQKYVMKKIPTVSVGELNDPEEFLRAQDYLLDIEFWKAIGNDLGWKDISCEYHEGAVRPMWQTKMHRMIDALAEGKSLEDYIATL